VGHEKQGRKAREVKALFLADAKFLQMLTDGQTDMMKLIIPFRDFDNAHENTKKHKLKLKYNYSIINDFSSKTTSSTYPTHGSLGQIRPT
jgi:hypothetical protein